MAKTARHVQRVVQQVYLLTPSFSYMKCDEKCQKIWVVWGRGVMGDPRSSETSPNHARVIFHAYAATPPMRRSFLPRDAMLSTAYAVVVCPSVRPSARLSVTLRYCIKTAKHRITQITPHESPLTPVF